MGQTLSPQVLKKTTWRVREGVGRRDRSWGAGSRSVQKRKGRSHLRGERIGDGKDIETQR